MSGEHGEIMPHLAGATNAKQLADCVRIPMMSAGHSD